MQLLISTYLDDAPARAQQAELEEKNREIALAIEANEKNTKEAFDLAMSAMRASYMVVSGLSQAMGGGMSQAFSAMYGIAMAGIQTTMSIAAALAASGPAGWVQASMMMTSLITAIVQLGAVLTGQDDLSRAVGGLNMSIQGIGGMLNMIPSW